MADGPLSSAREPSVRRDLEIFDRPYQIILTSPVHPRLEEVIRPLSGRSDMGLHTISSEQEGLKLVEQIPVSLLLFSVSNKAEVLGALSLLKSLVKLNRVQNLRIIALSKFDDPRLASTFRNLGCNEYLPQRIPRNSLMFKINLQLKALRARRLELERELALKLGIDLEPDPITADFGSSLSQDPIPFPAGSAVASDSPQSPASLIDAESRDRPPKPPGSRADTSPTLLDILLNTLNETPGSALDETTEGPSRSAWRKERRVTPGISRFLASRRARIEPGRAGAPRAFAPAAGGKARQTPPRSNLQIFIQLSDRLRQEPPHEVIGWLLESLRERLGAATVALIKRSVDEPGAGRVVSCLGAGFRMGQLVSDADLSGITEIAMACALHDIDGPGNAILGHLVLRMETGEPRLTDSQIALVRRLERPLGALLARL